MIRHAVHADIPFLIDMGARFHRESHYSTFGHFSKVAFERSLFSLCNGGVLLVLVSDGGPVAGMIGGIVAPHFVSGDLVATELFWWVEPEYRGRGMKLLDAFEVEVRRRWAKSIHMIAPVGAARLASVYDRKGYVMVESAFVKGL